MFDYFKKFDVEYDNHIQDLRKILEKRNEELAKYEYPTFDVDKEIADIRSKR